MGTKPKAAHKDDKEQSKLFIKKAREIGADEEHSASDELLGRLAKTPPQRHKSAKSKAERNR